MVLALYFFATGCCRRVVGIRISFKTRSKTTTKLYAKKHANCGLHVKKKVLKMSKVPRKIGPSNTDTPLNDIKDSS